MLFRSRVVTGDEPCTTAARGTKPARSGELVAELGHTKDERDYRRLQDEFFVGLWPRKSPCAKVPDPVALIGPRPGPADNVDATCGLFAARLPARRAAA